MRKIKLHQRFALGMCISAAGFVVGCSGDGPIIPEAPATPPEPGALISATIEGKVGVLLDEFPPSMRTRIADAIASRPETFWTARAKDQIFLTEVRLNYRSLYYKPEDKKGQLPLPPQPVQRIQFDPLGPSRTTVDGHDFVIWKYHLQSYLVTSLDSVPLSEQALATVGGTWDEPITLPVDPTLLFERTGYDCISEYGPPPESVETENAYTFYDDTCQEEVPGNPICHFTMPGPHESCVDGLKRAMGHVDVNVHYERVAWDEGIAAQNRVGQVTQADAPDMSVRADYLEHNHIVYRYFKPDDCAIQEQCIGGSGWRRLLMFDAMDHNVGGQALTIGPVTYTNVEGDTDLSLHGMYEWSACHKHYHFTHYAKFQLDGVSNAIGRKAGFCIINTDRLSNHEQAPIYSPFTYCDTQGTEAGWADSYQGGLPCQWMDITDTGVKGNPVDATLSFHSNPDGFLCEGQPVLDDNGKQVWEPTDFKTADGKPVEKPKCNFFDGSDKNDIGTTTVPIAEQGGVMTSACRKGQLGPLRNCEFKLLDDKPTCTPGAQVKLACSVADQSKPQIVRVCEYSFGMKQATTCSAVDGRANQVVDGDKVQITFTCPEKRDDVEKGGRYAIYTAPLWNGDGDSPVNCAPVAP
jgi:hypothetical protein